MPRGIYKRKPRKKQSARQRRLKQQLKQRSVLSLGQVALIRAPTRDPQSYGDGDFHLHISIHFAPLLQEERSPRWWKDQNHDS